MDENPPIVENPPIIPEVPLEREEIHKIYAAFDEDGNIQGFYDTTVFPDELTNPGEEEKIYVKNKAIPQNSIEVSSDVRFEIVGCPQRWKLIDGEIKDIGFNDRSHVPISVTRWQFAGQAAEEKIISMADAKKWAGQGIVPDILLQAVHDLSFSEDYKDRIELFLMGATDIPRSHELTPLLAQFFKKDSVEKLDQFFIDAKKR